MGAISFSIDRDCVSRLAGALELHTLVETGTFRGDSIARVRDLFPRILSIEVDAELAQAAGRRFDGDPGVTILHGASPPSIRDLLADGRVGRDGVLWWLDAHWCESGGVSDDGQCPLLQELEAISVLGDRSVIGIDDARLFLAPPTGADSQVGWPAFDDILAALRAIAPGHRLYVLNDVIWAVPPEVEGMFRAYAREAGVDWLAMAEKARTYDAVLAQVEEKEAEIQRLAKAAGERLAIIHDLEQTLAASPWEDPDARRILASELLRRPGPIFTAAVRIGLRRVPWLMPQIKLSLSPQHAPRPLPKRPIRRIPPLPHPAPSISIVTPSFNHGEFIGQTVASILDQGYPNLEYIVQDGGSTDNTVAVLESFGKRLPDWQSAPDRGQSHALSLGFAKTSGEIMAYLNSDDLLMPGALAVVADYFSKHPEVDAVYGQRILINDQGLEIGRWVLPPHDPSVMPYADYVPQETLFWRRSIWDRAGGMIDASFDFAMDWDLLLRIEAAGGRIKRLPIFLGAFRAHPACKSISQIDDRGVQEMDRLRLRTLGRSPEYGEVRRRIRSYLIRATLLHHIYRLGWFHQ